MTTKSKARGTATERLAVRYLQHAWPGAERRAMRGQKDPGDVVGVPHTTIEIKGDRSGRIAAWQAETLAEQGHTGDPLCLLIVRRDYQPVEKWDAWMPLHQLGIRLGEVHPWVRMDLVTAVAVLKTLHAGLSSPSSPTTA